MPTDAPRGSSLEQPADLVLRPADPADAAQVAEIHLAARDAAPMPPRVHPPDEVRHWVAGRVAADPVWVAERGQTLLGYARFPGPWLDDLYVLPDRQGQGVGTALLEVVKAQRPDGFCLWVFESNVPAREFYERHGLVPLERTDGTGNEEGAPDVRMAWPGADPLAFFRGLIDDVDAELGDLLARRAALTAAVQRLKAGSGMPAERDPRREAEIAAELARRAPALGQARLERIVHAIITESLDAAGD